MTKIVLSWPSRFLLLLLDPVTRPGIFLGGFFQIMTPFLGDHFQIMMFLYKLIIGFSKNRGIPLPLDTPLGPGIRKV